MGISYAMSVYDIESSTELFSIIANGHIFTANICAWLPFPGAICTLYFHPTWGGGG